MTFKKTLRFLALLTFIVLSSIVPIPLEFKRKDKLPTYKIEQIDEKKEDEEADDTYQVN